MISATVTKWGNSQGLRLNQAVMEALNAKTGDKLDLNIEGNKVVITKSQPEEELTFQELFKDYDGTEFDTKIEIPERVGNEKW